MGLGLDRDRLIKLIARRFPNLRKGKCDGAFRIELYDGERLKSIMDLRAHPAAGFPLGNLRGASKSMHRTMNHHRRLARGRRPEGTFEHIIRRFVEAPVVHDGVVAIGELWIVQRLEIFFDDKRDVHQLAELGGKMRHQLRVIVVAAPDKEERFDWFWRWLSGGGGKN